MVASQIIQTAEKYAGIVMWGRLQLLVERFFAPSGID